MARTLPVLTAIVLVIACGLVHGRWTDRWSESHAVEAAVAMLGHVPASIGDWRGQDVPLKVDPKILAKAGIVGHVSRRYENRRNGDAVTILLVCGRPGPISVHTPDVCYAGAGFEPKGSAGKESIQAGPPVRSAEFTKATFSKSASIVPSTLRILWSWNAGGAWRSPDNPRLAFASRPVLYKLYVIRDVAADDERREDEPSLEFTRELLPELDRALGLRP